MSRKINNKQQGFTIIELLVATLVFSVLLIVMLAAFIRTGDLFYKGVSMSKTQEDARNIVQSISDDIQFTGNPPDTVQADYSNIIINGAAQTPNTHQGVFCVGDHRYWFQVGAQVGGSVYGLGRDSVPAAAGCPVPAAGQSPAVQMLDAGMQLNNLKVTCTAGRCDVNIHVIFYGGSHDLFSVPSTETAFFKTNPWLAPDADCTGSLQGTDLCATVDYDSTVLENSAR